MDSKKPIEGEGNKTADKHYRDAATEYAKSGKVEQEAQKAERDIEKNPSEYDEAVEEGKRHSAGEAPGDIKRR